MALEQAQWRFIYPEFCGQVKMTNKDYFVQQACAHFGLMELEGGWSEFRRGLEKYEVRFIQVY
jgi:hypothetical protein